VELQQDLSVTAVFEILEKLLIMPRQTAFIFQQNPYADSQWCRYVYLKKKKKEEKKKKA